MRTILFSALLLAHSGAIAAPEVQADTAMTKVEEPNEAEFQNDFAAFTEEIQASAPNLPGLSAIVVREDRVVAMTNLGAANWGMAERDSRTPASTETRWYIASSTKSFVGAAFALLAQRGEIDLAWTLGELAPDIDFPPELRADEVSLRHLLSHTHGLASRSIEFRLAYSGQHDPDTLWKLLEALEPNSKAPLGTFKYGNLGYNIAAMLIERRLGRRWQDIVDNEVTGPLGMRATSTQGLVTARKNEPFAYPYAGNRERGPEPLYLIKQDETMQSAGGMYSSTRDMGIWLGNQLASARNRRSGELARAMQESLAPVATLDARFGPFERRGYGLGWYSGPYHGSTVHHSFGSFVGAMAHASIMPEANIGVAAMTNEDGSAAMAPHILAAFVYDWFVLGPDRAWTEGRGRLADLENMLKDESNRIASSLQERVSRSWQMSLPFKSYAGSYCSDVMGTIAIEPHSGGLGVEMGALRARAEPYTAPDTIRLELIPGRGMVGDFDVKDGKVLGFNLMETGFTRCD